MNTEQYFECDCHSHAISVYFDEEHPAAELSFWNRGHTNTTFNWKSRWKLIWTLLRGKEPFGDMVRLNPAKCYTLINYLWNHLESMESERSSSMVTLAELRGRLERRFKLGGFTTTPGTSQIYSCFPDYAPVYRTLHQQLLAEEDPDFPRWVREMIAAYVSMRNGCEFCTELHKAVAIRLNAECEPIVQRFRVADRFSHYMPPSKWDMVFALAERVRISPRTICTQTDIMPLLDDGMPLKVVQKICLLVSAICMFNRMVESLGTAYPQNREYYKQEANAIAQFGYLKPRVEN